VLQETKATQASPALPEAKIIEALPDGDFIVEISGKEYRAITPDHVREIERIKNDLTTANLKAAAYFNAYQDEHTLRIQCEKLSQHKPNWLTRFFRWLTRKKPVAINAIKRPIAASENPN
jgi:sugar-specific transcriptional regulator TrmB